MSNGEGSQRCFLSLDVSEFKLSNYLNIKLSKLRRRRGGERVLVQVYARHEALDVWTLTALAGAIPTFLRFR